MESNCLLCNVVHIEGVHAELPFELVSCVPTSDSDRLAADALRPDGPRVGVEEEDVVALVNEDASERLDDGSLEADLARLFDLGALRLLVPEILDLRNQKLNDYFRIRLEKKLDRKCNEKGSVNNDLRIR